MRNALVAFSLITGVLAGAPLLSSEASAAPVLTASMLQVAGTADGQAAVQSVQYYHHHYYHHHYYHHRYYRRY